MTKEDILIRKAERQDVPLLLDFICGIARYEKMENEVIASPEVLEREMFDEHRAEAVFAVVDGREVGFALYFYNFSTFIGHSGLYLEDLFVWPEDRGKGYGKALLLHLVRIAHEHHCGRMEWTCLNWNQPSIDFYLSLGAIRTGLPDTARKPDERREIIEVECEAHFPAIHYGKHCLRPVFVEHFTFQHFWRSNHLVLHLLIPSYPTYEIQQQRHVLPFCPANQYVVFSHAIPNSSISNINVEPPGMPGCENLP